MPFSINIAKNSNTPVFRQLVETIAAQIGEGRLSQGEKLPPERHLAESLGIARGTVARAYAELGRAGLIEVGRGRGSIVSGPPAVSQGRKEKAAALISETLDGLTGMRFSLGDARVMIDVAIREREEKLESINVAAVDCNPESLGIFERQIGLLSRVSVRKLLLEDVARDPDPARRLKDFDLILTTSTHHAELLALAPSLAARTAQVAVSPSQETVLSLAAVRPGQAIGVLCESRQFLAIIERMLKALRIGGAIEHLFLPLQPGWLAQFLKDRRVLIVPPAWRSMLTAEETRALQEFTETGGLTIVFDYQIEQGSLVYVEQRIRSLLEKGAAGETEG